MKSYELKEIKYEVFPTYGVACKRHLFDTLEEARVYNKKSKHKHPWVIYKVGYDQTHKAWILLEECE